MNPSYRYEVTKDTPLALWAYIELIEKNLDRDMTVAEINEALPYNPATLYRQIHEHIDPSMTVIGYHCLRRLQEARRMLMECDPQTTTIKEISRAVGFKYQSHFTRRYLRQWGETPRETMRRADYERRMIRVTGKPPATRKGQR